jgi:hypothetical protein
MIDLLFIPLFMVFNRYRGGGVVPFNPPGHRRFWTAGLVWLALAGFHDVWTTNLFAACFLAWSLVPWGRTYTLGRFEREASGPPNALERLVEGVADLRGRNDRLAFFLWQCIGCAPLALVAPWPVAAAMPFAVTAVYEVAWHWRWDRLPDYARRHFNNPTPFAEIWTGALWGVAVLTL